MLWRKSREGERQGVPIRQAQLRQGDSKCKGPEVRLCLHRERQPAWLKQTEQGETSQQEMRLVRKTGCRSCIKNSISHALAGVAQWIEFWPVNPRVTRSIPSEGICLRVQAMSPFGAYQGQPHIDVSLPLFLPYPVSKNK